MFIMSIDADDIHTAIVKPEDMDAFCSIERKYGPNSRISFEFAE